jgi:uncharacterized membrane protein YdcZ (DUF606 family)
MNLSYLLPLVVGVCGVLQGALNKRLAAEWGLGWVLMITSIVVLLLVGGLMLMNVYPSPTKFELGALKWWHVLPGLMGFLVILCIPISIARIGAMTSFLLVVASQVVVSGLWDRYMEGVELSWSRLVGASLTLVGAWLATK